MGRADTGTHDKTIFVGNLFYYYPRMGLRKIWCCVNNTLDVSSLSLSGDAHGQGAQISIMCRGVARELYTHQTTKLEKTARQLEEPTVRLYGLARQAAFTLW